MNIMEIISNLSLLYLVLTKTYSENKKNSDAADELMLKQMESLKRAIQILISIDLKNEMEQGNG